MKREPLCGTCGKAKVVLGSGILRCKECSKKHGRTYYERSRRRRDNQRSAYVLRRYGLSPEGLSALLASQQERCAICRRHWKDCQLAKRARFEVGFLQYLHIDHDHASGRVRGLLCNNCNAGIALLGEDETRLRGAIEYLQKHSGTETA